MEGVAGRFQHRRPVPLLPAEPGRRRGAGRRSGRRGLPGGTGGGPHRRVHAARAGGRVTPRPRPLPRKGRGAEEGGREPEGQAMNWVALKMLLGDRSKFLGIVFGVAFATLLMSQQISIFAGIMKRTGSQILDVNDAAIWVMDDKVRFVDEVPALRDTDLQRVRGVLGVAWAVRLYKGQVRARLEDGNFRNVILFGLDDTTLRSEERRVGK